MHKRKYNYVEGDVLNGLIYLKEVPDIRPIKAVFQCYCGNEFTTRVVEVRKNRVKSCGCYQDYRITHGDSLKTSKHHYIFNLWLNIRRRCYNKNYPRYKDWGGRGIIMYNSWKKDYRSFKGWLLLNLGERPSIHHTIDRINNEGSYVPNNLRWADSIAQANNRRILNKY